MDQVKADDIFDENCPVDYDNLQIKEEIEDVDIEEGYLNVDGKFIDLLGIKREFDSDDEEEREIEILPFDSETLAVDPYFHQNEENEIVVNHFNSHVNDCQINKSIGLIRFDKVMSNFDSIDFDTSPFHKEVGDQNRMSNLIVNNASHLPSQSDKQIKDVDDVVTSAKENSCQPDKNEGFVRTDNVMSNVKSVSFDVLSFDKESENTSTLNINSVTSKNKDYVPVASKKFENCQNNITNLDSLCQSDEDCIRDSKRNSNPFKVPPSVLTVISESSNNKSSNSAVSNVTENKVSKVNSCQSAASSKFKPTSINSSRKFYPNTQYNRPYSVKKIEYRPPRQLNTTKFRNGPSQRFRHQFPRSPTSKFNRFNRCYNYQNNYNAFNNNSYSTRNWQNTHSWETYNVILSALSQLQCQNFDLNRCYQQSNNFYNIKRGMNPIVTNNFFSDQQLMSVLNVQQNLTFLQSYSTILCAINQLNNSRRNRTFDGYTNNVTFCMSYLNMFGTGR